MILPGEIPLGNKPIFIEFIEFFSCKICHLHTLSLFYFSLFCKNSPISGGIHLCNVYFLCFKRFCRYFYRSFAWHIVRVEGLE